MCKYAEIQKTVGNFWNSGKMNLYDRLVYKKKIISKQVYLTSFFSVFFVFV